MSTPVCPIDKIIVQFDKKFQDTIKTESGIEFFKDTTYNPEWNTTVSGKVVSVPKRLSNDPFKKRIVPEVQVGDELFFSYLVVYDREVPVDSEDFYEVTQPESINKEYQNGFKDTIRLIYLNKKNAVCIWADKEGDLKQGFQGTPKQAEKWLSQFKFAGDDKMVYANMLWFNDQDYWFVDYIWAIAVKRGEEIKMIGGNTILEPEQVDRGEFMGETKTLIIPQHLRKTTNETSAKLLHIGTPLKDSKTLDVREGERVCFDKRYAQKYELWGKNYFILGQDRLIAKDVRL